MGRRAGIGGVVLVAALMALSVALAAPGQLDRAFGTRGKVVTDVGGLDWAGSIAIAPTGAVVVAGGSGDDIAVARYDAAGRLDSSLGGRGTVVTDLGGGNDGAGAVLAQPGGRIVVAAQRDGDLALVRYAANGTLDPSFGTGGVVVTDLGFEERAITVLRQAGGRLLVVCAAPDRLVLARFLADGRLDAGFQGDGSASTLTQGFDWRIAVLARDGKIVVAGAREVARPTQAMALAVARYRPDGRLDRTFAGDGLATTKARPHWHGAVKLAVRRDGRIVLGTHGHSSRGRAGFALVGLRRDGSIDRAFGDGGVTVNEVGYGVHALALDHRGRIVTVGRTTSLRDFVVARFLPDGRRDRSFAATVTDFGGVDTPFALALQPDGKIVAVGASSASRTSLVGDVAVARYLAS